MQNPDLNNLLNAIPMPLIAIGKSERIEDMNDAAAGFLGGEILGRHFVTGLRQPALLEAIEHVFAERTKKMTRFLGRDGDQEVRWEVICAPVMTKGDFSGVLVSFTDVSAVENANQMRRDFVANVSHELRTPLTALSGFIETLRGAARDDAKVRDRFLGIMENEAGRMNRLVGDLLSLSRVEGDERMRPTDEVDVAVVLRSVVQILRPLALGQGCEVILNLSDDSTCLRGDRDQLQQVFTNLVENALKYGGKDKIVSIDVEAIEYDRSLRSPTLRVSVRDQGEGIQPEHIPRLTERFYRIDSHRSREMGGTGLGLAIVKHIVNRHRGRFRVESVPGEGSSFAVVLLQDTPHAEPKAAG